VCSSDLTRERVAAIHGAGRRLLRLINDVLDLSKIESGSMTLQSERFEVWRELDEVVRLFSPRVEAKGLSLQVSLDLPRPSWVTGDRNKIGQIVINLFGNALKFTEQGQISLRAGRQGERLWLEVEDTGPGLAADDLARLFTPFQQGAAGRDKGGTGLGLALSRHMARAMGGDLTMSSVPGQGTVARVWLPLVPQDAPHADAALPEGVGRVLGLDPATPCRVLVVEDDVDSRVILVQALVGLGCKVAEAGDGEAAWQRLNAQPFDIVFTDIRMPVLDGLALLQRLRAEARFAALPVVAVSASSLEHERRFYVQQGFHDFVGKPYEFSEIRQMLARHAQVRWRYDGAPAATADTAIDPPARWTATTVADLTTLAEHARNGDMQAVRASLQPLSAEVLGSTAWRRLEGAARQYDFASLAEQADDLARHGPQGEPQ
jgi:CheY-like chemotaxis protein